jgi:hypothetical protein
VPETSGAEAEDQAREARAYNQSIYFMVGMPYLLLGTVGYLVYRGLRLKALSEQGRVPPPGQPLSPGAPDGQGDRTCSPRSPGVVS